MQKLFGLLLFNIYSMQYKYSNLHEIYLVFLSQFNQYFG